MPDPYHILFDKNGSEADESDRVIGVFDHRNYIGLCRQAIMDHFEIQERTEFYSRFRERQVDGPDEIADLDDRFDINPKSVRVGDEEINAR
ncbi:MAG: hypothetical protein WEA36_10735 [Balneolaceae bacterium]